MQGHAIGTAYGLRTLHGLHGEDLADPLRATAVDLPMGPKTKKVSAIARSFLLAAAQSLSSNTSSGVAIARASADTSGTSRWLK